jgi:hypothetical protein
MTRFEKYTIRTLERLHAQAVRDWELAYAIPDLINEKDEREGLAYIHAIARTIKELSA